jgi:SPP1 gp7 family putative phage head morphogenesis protein
MANQDLLDKLTRHQIFIQRLAAGQSHKVQQGLESIKYRMEKYLLGTNYSILDEPMSARLQLQMTDIDQYLRASWADIPSQYRQFGIDFMEYEAKFSADAIGKTTSVPFLPPSMEQIISSFDTNILNLVPNKITGRTVEGHLEHFGNEKRTQMLQTIRDGYLFGWTNREAIKQVNQVVDLQKNQTNTWVRTLTNHLAVQARAMTLEENDDILDGYEWVATLDSRTSFICMSRDGIIYPNSNDPERSPKPPAHFGCRSTVVPAVNPEFDLLADEPETRFARGLDGKRMLVDGKLNYEQWLRKQPKEFQIKVLGRKRQELFEKKKLPISRFVDPDGRVLSLDELKDLDVQFNGMSVQQVVAATAPEPEPVNPLDFRAKSNMDLNYKTPQEAVQSLSDRLKANAKDPRHPQTNRFSGRKMSQVGNLNFTKAWEDEDVGTLMLLDASMDELDELARLFNVPPLRGFTNIRSNSSSAANMGDGIMGINRKVFRREVPSNPQFYESVEAFKSSKKLQTREAKSTWNRAQGYDKANRPFTVDSFESNSLDEARSTLFHEFGHHIHQMTGVDPKDFTDKALKRQYRQIDIPVEKLMKGEKYKAANRQSPSRYGDSDEHEWFAENFALWVMGKRDRNDPLFLELIEELIRNANK